MTNNGKWKGPMALVIIWLILLSMASSYYAVNIPEDGEDGVDGIRGPQGLPGPQGIPGKTGPTGPRGYKGDKGSTGATGSRGPEGSQGPKGDKGDPGQDLLGSLPPVITFPIASLCPCKSINFYVEDPENDTMKIEVYITWSGASSWYYVNSFVGNNGHYDAKYCTSKTVYTWRIDVDDGNNIVSETKAIGLV